MNRLYLVCKNSSGMILESSAGMALCGYASTQSQEDHDFNSLFQCDAHHIYNTNREQCRGKTAAAYSLSSDA